MTLDFFYYFLLITRSATSFLPSGSWIVLFWLPAETLSLKRLLGSPVLGAQLAKSESLDFCVISELEITVVPSSFSLTLLSVALVFSFLR